MLRSFDEALGLEGVASGQEIRAMYRALAQRAHANPDALVLERLRFASLALGQELAHGGHDAAFIEATLIEEGCPAAIAAEVARASGGLISRVVKGIDRNYKTPAEEAYAALSARLYSAQAMRVAIRDKTHGLGFLAKLVVLFLVFCVVLYAALQVVPKAYRAGVEPPGPKQEAPPMPVHMVPAEPKKP